MTRPKLFLLLAALPICAFLLCAFAVFRVDAVGVFNHGIPHHKRFVAESYVRALGKSNAGLVAHQDERLVKRSLLLRSSADCWMVGSSRIMNISGDQMRGAGCSTFVNLGVSGGGFEDIVAKLYLLSSKTGSKTIYAGIDPWTFRRHADSRHEEFGSAVSEGMAYFNLPFSDYPPPMPEVVKKQILLSWHYVAENLSTLKNGAAAPPFVDVAQSPIAPEEAMTRPDGSHVYSRDYRKKTPKHWDSQHSAYKIARPFIDPSVVTAFGAIARRLKSRNVKLVLVLMPYHPRVWDCELPEVCKALQEAESAAKGLSQQEGIGMIGSFSAAAMGLAPEDFLSDMFIQPEKFTKVLAH